MAFRSEYRHGEFLTYEQALEHARQQDGKRSRRIKPSVPVSTVGEHKDAMQPWELDSSLLPHKPPGRK